MRIHALGLALCLAFGVPAAGAEFRAQTAHKGLIEGFNSRDWSAVKRVLADDVVFHRANAKEVFIGPDAVVEPVHRERWTRGRARRLRHHSRREQRDLLSRVLHDDVAAPNGSVLEASNPGLAGC